MSVVRHVTINDVDTEVLRRQIAIVAPWAACGVPELEGIATLLDAILDSAEGYGTSRVVSAAVRSTDPPMGYGYRQLKVDGTVYALRWGQSGRITGAYGPMDPSNARLGPDPATLPYDAGTEGCVDCAWANAQRWEVVS